jgi:phospholipase C
METGSHESAMVIATYDEFGGQWDHATPPGLGGKSGPHDIWGPGTRIPALVISPFVRGQHAVDYSQHDTTSIVATIEHRYGLDPLGSRTQPRCPIERVQRPPVGHASPLATLRLPTYGGGGIRSHGTG